jgi:hypothetical protein
MKEPALRVTRPLLFRTGRVIILVVVAAVAASIVVVCWDRNGRDPARGSGSCQVVEIARPADLDDARVVAADPGGSFIIVSAYRNLADKAFLLRNGTSRPLPIGADQPSGVNSSGIVVGTVDDYSSGPHSSGWAWDDGQEYWLRALGGDNQSAATAINQRGDIAGWSSSYELAGEIVQGMVTQRPVVWPAGSWPRQPRELPVPNGHEGIANDIDDDGTVVGRLLWWEGDQEHSRAYAWGPDGTGHELPIAGDTEAYAIRDGWVVGAVITGTTSIGQVIRVPILWNLRDGSSHMLSASLLLAYEGRAVGKGGLVIGQTDQYDGFLLRGSEQIRLPGLNPAGKGVPVLVTDNGAVIGYTARAADPKKAVPVIWRC